MTPTKGTKRQAIRIDDDLWQRFGATVGDDQRSARIRAYMEWQVEHPEAELPKRPRRRPASSEGAAE